jgi:hypothetical protein
MRCLTVVLMLTVCFAVQAQSNQIEAKLKLLIPQLKLKNASIKEALAIIQEKSRLISPDKKGVLIIIKDQHDKLLNRKYTADFTNISVKNAIKAVCHGSGLHYRVSQSGKAVLVSSEVSTQIETKFYRVSSIFASYVSPQNTRLVTQKKLTEFFESVGVKFPKGTNVTYLAGKSLVSMSNTSNNQEKTKKALLQLGCLR